MIDMFFAYYLPYTFFLIVVSVTNDKRVADIRRPFFMGKLIALENNVWKTG